MSDKEKVQGPASYFPSVEKKYGHPVEFWFEKLAGQQGLKHKEMVDWLKAEFAMGHGHANALVAFYSKREGL